MTLRLATIVLDVSDVKRAASFWREALHYDIKDEGETWTTLADPRGKGIALGLQPRDDPKRDANRAHVDLAAADVEAEARRLEGLGAKRADWPYYPPNASWIVMLDPDGNEFCIVPA
ncbi:MAG: hypothetical protein QOE90_3606 [Thermoplasmata archaeon]|jgi:predicted enzyme related to lactoylglutathione lyase|nr:hypothetical protein [Thermoplasmata archaeon]